LVPLAFITRNNHIESIHYGFIYITDSSENIIYSAGDCNAKIFFRSCVKPIQALALIKSGASKKYNLTLKEIAVACASHAGQEIHQKTVLDILHKIEIDESYLQCGITTPENDLEYEKLIVEGKPPTVLHCGCSGNHSAMLALAKFRGYNLNNYREIDHPVQQEILKTVSEFCGMEPDSIEIGIDGCGVPAYFLPIKNIAFSYAKLTAISCDKGHPYHESCNTVFNAMNRYPEMVAGDSMFCTELMKTAKGKLIGKIGSEGVYCLGIKNGSLGICIKIADGNKRAVYSIVVQILKEFGILNHNEIAMLRNWHYGILKNNHGEIIGNILPVPAPDRISDIKQYGFKLNNID